MGYILPITRNTYTQYQMRELPDERSPHHIEKPFKIVLKQLNDEEAHYGRNHDEEQREEEVREQPILEAFQINALNRSELTGKGALFNDSI